MESRKSSSEHIQESSSWTQPRKSKFEEILVDGALEENNFGLVAPTQHVNIAPRANVGPGNNGTNQVSANVSQIEQDQSDGDYLDEFAMHHDFIDKAYLEGGSQSSSESLLTFQSKPLSHRLRKVVLKQFELEAKFHSRGHKSAKKYTSSRRLSDQDDNISADNLTKKPHKKQSGKNKIQDIAAGKDMKDEGSTSICSLLDKLILLPENSVRQTWDIVVIFLLIYTLVFLPLRVAFQDASDDILPLDISIDVLFFIDILFSFVSAYKTPNGVLVTEFEAISKHYLKTWFILDFIATFPFYAFGETQLRSVNTLFRIPRLIKMFRLVRLVKLLRAYRLKKLFALIEYSPKVHQGFVRILKLLVLIICFGHLSACLWFFVGIIGEEEDGLSWINDPSGKYSGIADESIGKQYITSLYFCISALATVGFGDVQPQTKLEMGFTIVLTLFGATIFSYITATISSIMHDFDQKATIYRAKMANLIRFIRSSNLSNKLQVQLVNEMGLLWRLQTPVESATLNFREELPKTLLYEVSLEMHASLLDKSPFFSLFDSHLHEYAFVGELVADMQPGTAFEGEFIGNIGEDVKFWGIVKDGSILGISPLDPSMELMIWMSGDTMGEVGIFLTNQWAWNMLCNEDTSYYYVSTDDFLAILAHHRTVSRKLVELAGQRIERIVKTKKRYQAAKAYKKLKTRKTKKSTLLYRLEIARHDSMDSFNEAEANNAVLEYILSDESYVKHLKQAVPETELDTSTGRWKLIRKFVIGTTDTEEIVELQNISNVAALALEVKKFRYALDDVEQDFEIWQKGMTF